MKFGIMFFSSTQTNVGADKYALLRNAARFADEHEFSCVWTPERHFHEFGGLFPNPSVTSAALAILTERLQIRAGSLIAPLHNDIRIAEEWAMVDNLSGGRVAISFGSGWNVNDFVFFPERYSVRQATMYRQIETIRRLWKGEPVVVTNSFGKEVSLTITPKPIQSELPIWVTTSGNIETFKSAGKIGANVLTHLLGQDSATLAEKIAAYRRARQESSLDPTSGKVSLMLHTFVGTEIDAIRRTVRRPFREYLRSAIRLEQDSARHGGRISGGHVLEAEDVAESDTEELLDIAFERYLNTAALIGTPDMCIETVLRLKAIGVDEVACLIDFGVDADSVMGSLKLLASVCEEFPRDRGRTLNASAGAVQEAVVQKS